MRGWSYWFVALLAGTLVVGCGEKKDDPPEETKVPPAVKEDGTTPANFSCVGGGNPFTGGTTDTVSLLVTRQPISGDPPREGDVTVHAIDATDGSTVLASSTATDTTGCSDMPPSAPCGETTLDLELNALVAMHLESSANDLVPTYYYNYLTPPSVPVDPINLLIIPASVRDVFIGFLGALPSDFAGQGLGAGAVTDCDGDTVKNVVVEMPEASLIGYFSGGTPDQDAVSTDTDGRFIVAGIPPTTTTPGTVVGKIYTGTEAEGVPDTEVVLSQGHYYADSVTLVVALPKPD
jgi:hypothetical protein